MPAAKTSIHIRQTEPVKLTFFATAKDNGLFTSISSGSLRNSPYVAWSSPLRLESGSPDLITIFLVHAWRMASRKRSAEVSTVLNFLLQFRFIRVMRVVITP